MPWYYAGPDAKPVGPVSLEQLHALRAAGSLTADTFVIEHTGAGAANLAWKRYAEVFAPLPSVPPAPAPGAAVSTTYPAAPVPHQGQMPAPGPMISPAPPAAHPLFPSAAPAGYPPATASGYPMTHAVPPGRPSNAWCVWGFVLSLVSCLLAFICGIGLLPALISAVLSTVGLYQLSKHREQGGQGLAICGLIFSFLAIVIAVIFIIFVDLRAFGNKGITVSEQTSNDAE